MPTFDFIENKLQGMVDYTYCYAKQNHLVKSIAIDKEEEKFTIVTSLNTFTRKFESAEEFLRYWKYVPDATIGDQAKEIKEPKEESSITRNVNKRTVTTQRPIVLMDPPDLHSHNGKDIETGSGRTAEITLETESGLANELVDLLKDNIKKVSANPKYLQQAIVVEKSVSAIINIQRLKLDMYRTLKTVQPN